MRNYNQSPVFDYVQMEICLVHVRPILSLDAPSFFVANYKYIFLWFMGGDY